MARLYAFQCEQCGEREYTERVEHTCDGVWKGDFCEGVLKRVPLPAPLIEAGHEEA